MSLLITALIISWTPTAGRTTPLVYSQVEEQPHNAPSGIPILMYHHVSDPIDGYYGVSTGRFLSDLQQLFDAGFYLIMPEDLEDGLMRIPPDRMPVMLTFDDGWQDNFNMIYDGSSASMDPMSVVGILERFCDEHPDFGRGAVFFISWDKIPFGQSESVTEKFNLLLDMGYSIGNHTNMHGDFMVLPRFKWDNSVLLPMEKFRKRLGLRTSQVFAMAYPGGRFPRDVGSVDYLSSFRFDGRQVVRMGFLANGSVSSMSNLLDSPEGWFRIGRLDMSQYSVPQLLNWRNIMDTGPRHSLHDPLPYRLPPS